MNRQITPYRSVLITGAGGYIGRQVVSALAAERRLLDTIVASDLRAVPPAERLPGVEYVAADICAPELAEVLKKYRVEVVVHLAAVVTPGKRADRQLEYRVDVLGTENVLTACIETGVRKIIYTSSGAAYGYHADNAAWLDETDPIRGNREFAYAYHKRLVEGMLARHREAHPALEQLIFRPGFILGATTRNQITNLFDQPRITGLKGAASPFVIVWDQDVVGAVLRGIFQGGSGIYNLAGDGTLTLQEMAAMLGKPYRALPVWLVTAALWLGKKLGLTQYGPEQVRFLRYRPVLSNRRLKEEFGYALRKTSREVFEFYLAQKRHAVPDRSATREGRY
jgi:UDP-glucose 4-epimerase